MEPNEKPVVIYSIYRDTDAKYVMFVTKNGLAKKTSLDEYVKTKKKGGIAAINIKEGDELAAVTLVKNEQLILITSQGMAIRFDSMEIPATSRTTSGIKGITLNKEDYVVAALPIRDSADTLAVFTSGGMAKRVSLTELPIQKRAGKGLMTYKPTATTGAITAATLVSENDSVLMLGDKTNICIEASDIPTLGRASIGNQMIKGSKILSVSKV